MAPIQSLKSGGLAILVIISMTLSVTLYSDGGLSTCANDQASTFCEDFEHGSVAEILPLVAKQGQWSIRFPDGSITLTSPGLNGTQQKATFLRRGPNAGTEMDRAFGMIVRNGEKFWIEWWIQYQSGFLWDRASSVANWTNKTLDLRSSSAIAGCQNRLLLVVVGGQRGSDYTQGVPVWALYPNYTCPNSLGKATDPDFWPNIVPGFTIVGGPEYHCVVEVTSATGRSGRLRMWINDQLIADHANIQTCGEGAGCNWNTIMLGGPQSNATSGQTWSYDQIRITRTNLAPLGNSNPPAPPTNLMVH